MNSLKHISLLFLYSVGMMVILLIVWELYVSGGQPFCMEKKAPDDCNLCQREHIGTTFGCTELACMFGQENLEKRESLANQCFKWGLTLTH